jgi:hypothetical protein
MFVGHKEHLVGSVTDESPEEVFLYLLDLSKLLAVLLLCVDFVVTTRADSDEVPISRGRWIPVDVMICKPVSSLLEAAAQRAPVNNLGLE